MGHKVHPKIHRTQVIYTWPSRWYSDKQNYRSRLAQDTKIRSFLRGKFKDAGIDNIMIERSARELTVTIFAAKPGFIIGRGGQGIELVRKHIERRIVGFKTKVRLNVQEVKNPGASAQVVMQQIISDIERRVHFRRVMKHAIGKVMKAGAKGVKLQLAGRLNGVEIARTEKLAAGTVPLSTLRADVDYASGFARTIYGAIGVKVWIYKGQVFERQDPLAQ